MGVAVLELQSRKKRARHASMICISDYRPGRVFELVFVWGFEFFVKNEESVCVNLELT